MAEPIKVTFKSISDLGIGSKVVVTDKNSGEKAVVTHVSFNVDENPGVFNDILMAMAADHGIDVTFMSAQSKLPEV